MSPEAGTGNASLAALSAGTRAAGAVIALGYLTGWVSGPLPAAVGGLGLMTFGRCVAVRRSEIFPVAAALGVVAIALGAGALRWGSLDLGFVRGAQAVLGPTVVVGSAATVAGSVLAAGACVLALGAWLFPMRPQRSARLRRERCCAAFGGGHVHWRPRVGNGLRAAVPWAAEGVPVALAAVTVFWGPKVVAGSSDAAVWAASTLAFTAAAAAVAVMLQRVPARFRWLPLTFAALAATAGAGLTAGAV